MANTSQSSETARRYASALFDLAQDTGVLANVHNALTRFGQTITGSKDLSRLIASPLYSRADKAATLTEVARRADMPDLVARFLGTVAANGRAAILPGVTAAFDALYARQRGVQRAVARTAAELTENQRARIEAILARSHGGDVELATEVDPGLVGGIQLRIGSTLIDASLRAKLDRLNTAMKGA